MFCSMYYIVTVQIINLLLKNETAASVYKISNHPIETRDYKAALDTPRRTHLSPAHDLTSLIPPVGHTISVLVQHPPFHLRIQRS
jgi:hypothetical protein